MTTPLDKAVEAMALDRAVEAVTDALDGEQLKWLASSPPNRKALAAAALQAADDLLREHYWGELRERLLGEAERLERQMLDGESPADLTAATVRAVKAQGIRDALATTQKEEL